MRVDQQSCQLGKRNKLDAEQGWRSSFNSVYVLTFNDEAKDNLDDQAAAEFIKNKNRLLQWQDRPTNNR
jgi:hypothetical protein